MIDCERLGNHFEAVGRGLDQAVESYNKAVGSLETRVMVSARKFSELGAPVTEELPPINIIDTTTRNLTLDFDDEEDTGAVAAGKAVIPGISENDVCQN